MKSSIIKFIPYVAIVVLLFVLFDQCSRTNDIRDNERKFLNDTISYYQNEIGQEVSEKISLKGDKKTLEVLLSKQIDSTSQLKRIVKDFRGIDAAGNITTVTKFDTVFIPYSNYGEFVTIKSSNFKEKLFQKNTENYFISGKTSNSGINIHSLTIPNTISFAIGKKKTGFLKSDYRIEAVNSNPYVKTTGLDSYTLEIPKKRFGLGLYVGYGISDNFIFKPSVGIGLSYNLIRF